MLVFPGGITRFARDPQGEEAGLLDVARDPQGEEAGLLAVARDPQGEEAGLLAVARDPQSRDPTRLWMSQLRCFHFLFVSAIEGMKNAFMASPNKKCPPPCGGPSIIL
jgi:hypothetical protein